MYSLIDVIEWKFKCQYALRVGDTYDTLVWLEDNVPKPTEQECIKFTKEYAKYRDTIDYIAKRRDMMPSIPDQLDMQYHDAINGTTVWIDTIRAIKEKIPK